MSRYTGPGRPPRACRTAVLTNSGTRLGSVHCSAHLVIGLKAATWSISWNAPLPRWLSGAEPPMANSGAQSAQALATPVTRFVAPGPEAAMHTPRVFFTRPNAWAIMAAAAATEPGSENH